VTGVAVDFPIDLNQPPDAPPAFELQRGDADGRNAIRVTLTDADDQPVDLTLFGDTWTSQARGSSVVIDLEVDDTNAAGGVLVISVADEDSPGLPGRLRFDIQVTGGSISPLTVFKGKLTVGPEVTR
jgi:hypothetical protein